MPINKNTVKSVLKYFGYFFMPINFLCLAVYFIRYLLDFKKAEIIVFMPDAGFGHTITGPDVVRRLFKGRTCLFVFFSEYGRHNCKVGLIWPEIKVISLPLLLPLPTDLRGLLSKFVFNWAGRVNTNQKSYYLWDIYKSLPLPGDLNNPDLFPKNISKENFSNSYLWAMGYFKLLREIPAAKLHLPRNLIKFISNRISSRLPLEMPITGKKLCCLYLRQKGTGSGDVTSSARVGSPWEFYTDSISLLINSGYLVMVTGDVVIPTNIISQYGAMLFDAKVLKVDKYLFYLFAATESDIFIGEAGGGAWLPGLNDIPRLLLNSFPFGYGLPNSWVYYKTLRDKDGNLVDLRRLFSDYIYQYEFKDLTLGFNSSEEILSAVTCFLQARQDNCAKETVSLAEEALPAYSWIRQSQAKISPAWLNIYRDQINEASQCCSKS